jgi:arginyl-tRNA synthetase
MSTLDLPGLSKRLEGLGLGPIPQFSEAQLLHKPLDIGRSYLADILGWLVPCDSITAYNSIQSPNDLFPTADLTVPLPKLCRGADSRAVAMDLIQRVRHSLPFAVYCGPD